MPRAAVLVALLAIALATKRADARSCSGSTTVNLQPFTITNVTDHDGGGSYQPGAMCSWTATAPPGYVVRAAFVYCDTASSADTLALFDGASETSDALLVTYFGRTLHEGAPVAF